MPLCSTDSRLTRFGCTGGEWHLSSPLSRGPVGLASLLLTLRRLMTIAIHGHLSKVWRLGITGTRPQLSVSARAIPSCGLGRERQDTQSEQEIVLVFPSASYDRTPLTVTFAKHRQLSVPCPTGHGWSPASLLRPAHVSEPRGDIGPR